MDIATRAVVEKSKRRLAELALVTSLGKFGFSIQDKMEISGVVPAPTRDRSVRSAVHLHLPNAAERGSRARARYSQVSTSTATKLFAHANQSNYPAQKVPLPNVASRPFTRSPCLFIAFLTRHEIRRLLPSAATSASVDGVFGDRELLPDPPREVRLRGGRQGCSVRPDLRGHDRQVRLAVGPGGRDGEKHHECRGAHLQDRTIRNEPGLRNRPGPDPVSFRSDKPRGESHWNFSPQAAASLGRDRLRRAVASARCQSRPRPEPVRS